MNLEEEDDQDDSAWTVEQEDLEDEPGPDDEWLTAGAADNINKSLLCPEQINSINPYSTGIHLGAIKPLPSQTLEVKYSAEVFKIDLDSGATVSFLRLDVAKLLQLSIKPNGQLAILADKKSRMQSLGEIDILVTENETGTVVLRLRALIVETLGVACYAGQTFHLDNGVVADVTQKTISFHHGRHVIHQENKYGQLQAYPPPYLTVDSAPSYIYTFHLLVQS